MLRQLFDAETSTYTYLISSQVDNKKMAILVDPVYHRVEQYLNLLKELSITLVAVADTHVHADHITAAGLLQDQTQCDIIMSDKAKVTGVTKALAHLDTFCIGNTQFICFETPGHTSDSCCFYNEEQHYVLTGDTLLVRGTGRTDFQSGNSKQAWSSLNHLMTLPSETRIYPGHDNGMTWSTIQEEKQHNPRLQVKTAEAYHQLMLSLNLPTPKLIHETVPANLNCGRI
ncbi:MAG: MBL fold metallo-hydrolase [Endozoicomonadaceae bacterium]|nr:MBL fold metallo-hydrolase [Endozoicomonadaceae bacterium]MBE8233195.1 MBL fold metallo-hydrolase [Endozoicomonadaceae bacterium]